MGNGCSLRKHVKGVNPGDGMTAEQMQNVMRPHPTFNEGITEAFEDVTGQSIHSAPPRK